MKFPRNSRLLRSSFDMAPFAAVLFLLVMFLMLGAFMPVPGVNLSLQLPAAENLPGAGQPTIAVAVDANGRFYFANQIVAEDKLKSALKTAAQKSPAPLTLVIHADKTVTYDRLIHLALLAHDAGIQNALLATLPRVVTAPAVP